MLAAMARACNDSGQWAEVFDDRWRSVYLTDDARRIFGGGVELASFPVGEFLYGPARVNAAMAWRGGHFPLQILRELFALHGPWILADTAGGKDELRALVDPRLSDVVDQLTAEELPPAIAISSPGIYSTGGTRIRIPTIVLRLRDTNGGIAGTAFILKPDAGMAVLARIAALGDPRHFERTERVAKPARRPAAILFADLESSTQLARRLSTASYFTLVRRLARAADQAAIEAGGLVGSHAGDGIVAFFLAETSGSESAAAHACITAARAIRDAAADVAARCELSPEDVVMRLGLHWGANLYVGQIATCGRTEVTALGDPVNETARIEACATGGLALASKDLMERLEPEDAAALDLDPDHARSDPPAATPARSAEATTPDHGRTPRSSAPYPGILNPSADRPPGLCNRLHAKQQRRKSAQLLEVPHVARNTRLPTDARCSRHYCRDFGACRTASLADNTRRSSEISVLCSAAVSASRKPFCDCFATGRSRSSRVRPAGVSATRWRRRSSGSWVRVTRSRSSRTSIRPTRWLLSKSSESASCCCDMGPKSSSAVRMARWPSSRPCSRRTSSRRRRPYLDTCAAA